MRDPFSRNFFSWAFSPEESWLGRIRENLQQFRTPARIFPSSANGAPLHVLRWEKSGRAGRAQRASLLTHAVILTVLVLIAVHPPGPPPKAPGRETIKKILPFPRNLRDLLRGQQLADGTGSGGNRIPIPTTVGNLLPPSSIQIVRPSLPAHRDSIFPVPPTILDPTAEPVLTAVGRIGLPWMREETNSAGPGDSNTIGSGPGETMGDGPIDGPGGRGKEGYRADVTFPRCAYCPDPQYTDEARAAKLQGKVTLRVLVGADGRTAQVQILKGLGMGLDERTAETARTWRFVPARQGAGHAVPVWVTIEVTFQLI